MTSPNDEHASTEPDDADGPPKRSTSLARLLAIDARIKSGQLVDAEELREHAAATEALNSAMESIRARLASIVEETRSAWSGLPEFLQQLGQWHRELSEKLAPAIREAMLAIRDLPPKVQAAVETLAYSGWFLDGEQGFSELSMLESLLRAGEVSKVDALLVQHYEDRLQDIEDALVAALPHRERILRLAFCAHRRGEYELSVPALLAQSDGACLDLTGYEYFRRASGRPQAAQYVDNNELNALTAALLTPLQRTLPINASPRERQRILEKQGLSTWRELNRHLVLHGISSDYGTQVNSLKAVSFINYLVSFLAKQPDIRRDPA